MKENYSNVKKKQLQVTTEAQVKILKNLTVYWCYLRQSSFH